MVMGNKKKNDGNKTRRGRPTPARPFDFVGDPLGICGEEKIWKDGTGCNRKGDRKNALTDKPQPKGPGADVPTTTPVTRKPSESPLDRGQTFKPLGKRRENKKTPTFKRLLEKIDTWSETPRKSTEKHFKKNGPIYQQEIRRPEKKTRPKGTGRGDWGHGECVDARKQCTGRKGGIYQLESRKRRTAAETRQTSWSRPPHRPPDRREASGQAKPPPDLSQKKREKYRSGKHPLSKNTDVKKSRKKTPREGVAAVGHAKFWAEMRDTFRHAEGHVMQTTDVKPQECTATDTAAQEGRVHPYGGRKQPRKN